MKRTIGRRITAALLALALWAGMLPVVSAVDPAENSVTLSGTTMTIKVGEQKDLTATVIIDGQSYTTANDHSLPSDAKVTWSVENDSNNKLEIEQDLEHPLRVTVTANGLLETTEGTLPVVAVTVERTAGTSLTASCEVTITPAEQTGVSLSSTSLEVTQGYTEQLKATVTPESAPQDVIWASENENVATVDQKGNVLGVAPGKTQITATAGSQVASCTVTVPGIVLEETEVTLWERETHTLTCHVYGSSLEQNEVQWSSSNPKAVTVDRGYLQGIAEGEATITATVQGSTYKAACKVTVKRNVANVIKVTVDAGTPVPLSGVSGDIARECSRVLGQNLSYVSGLSYSTSQGTLYYQYQSESDTGAGVGTGEKYYASPTLGQLGLDNVTFVPKADFSGIAVINYTGYADGSTFFQGTIEVTVEEQEDIVYSTTSDQPVQFNADDFNRLCKNTTGKGLKSVTFSLPSEPQGTLYYRYTAGSSYNIKVTSTQPYGYSSSPNLSDVYFVPAAGRTGEVIVSFTAKDTSNTSFRGRVRILVSAPTATGDLNYSIAQGGRLTLDDTDFNNLSQDATGYSLSYVRFTLPSASCGTLYYNYTSSGSYSSTVSAGSNYYRSSTPYLDRVTFVPAKDFSGTVEIPFQAWDTKGNQFSGTLSITVRATGNGVVRYSTYQGGTVTFDDADFNTLCGQMIGGTLRSVRFTLPSSSQGTLYYNYRNGTYDSKVSATKSYYRSSSPYLDKVSFVAGSTFTGTVSIPFTAWNTSGDSFSGTVEITVDAGASQIAYTLRSGGAVTMVDNDFNRLCEYETGDALRYVRFTLPASSRGVLYYDYDDQDGSYASKVSSSSNYYYSSSPYLERVTFVADNGYTGTFELAFTGWSTGGKQFTGTVKLTVNPAQSASVIYYSAADGTANFQSRDFVSACASRGLGSLSSVRFTLPSSSTGQLLYGGSSVKSTTSYYPNSSPSISDVSFTAASGFRGVAILNYTGTDSRGNTYQGQICITVQSGQISRYFDDMGNQVWAISAVDLLYERGIVTGTSSRTFNPKGNITRGDFVLMLARTFSFPTSGTSGFNDVPANSYYAGAIASAKALGIADGYPDGGFHPKDPISRQDAMVLLRRAMTVDGWALGSGQSSLLDGFWDGGQVSAYAEEAVATMLRYGILTGTPEGLLQPRDSMSRAEMAVVLSRVLAL